MIASILALGLLVCPQESPALTADGTDLLVGEGHAFVELTSPEQSYVIGQPFHIVLRFGLERDFQQTAQVQLFRTQLDVPIQLQANWFSGSETLLEYPVADAPPAGWPRFALGDQVLAARPLGESTRDGQVFQVYEYSLAFKVEEPKTLRLSAVELRYAFATEFEESFLNGRSPSNRVEALVRSAALELEIKPLPLDNPPIDFSGAIGSFRISGSLGEQGQPGAPLRWTLRIEGQGNHHEIEHPSVAQFEDFRLLGSLSSASPSADGARLFHYDLMPRTELLEHLPAFSFNYFDVDAGDFRKLTTPALILPRAVPVARVENSPKIGHESLKEESFEMLYMGLGALVLVGVFCLLRGRLSSPPRQASGALGSKRLLERQAAAVAFKQALEAGPSQLLGAYSGYLGSCLNLAAGELQAEGLAECLGREGISVDLAERAQAALSSLLAASYGRGECSALGQAAPEIVQELALHWS